jgi:asparagine synthase (glutamine-hydrolysing)
MCGISGIVGEGWERSQLEAMVAIQDHRGPDDNGIYVNASGLVGLGHNRLSIVDLTDAVNQPTGQPRPHGVDRFSTAKSIIIWN